MKKLLKYIFIFIVLVCYNQSNAIEFEYFTNDISGYSYEYTDTCVNVLTNTGFLETSFCRTEIINNNISIFFGTWNFVSWTFDYSDDGINTYTFFFYYNEGSWYNSWIWWSDAFWPDIDVSYWSWSYTSFSSYTGNRSLVINLNNWDIFAEEPYTQLENIVWYFPFEYHFSWFGWSDYYYTFDDKYPFVNICNFTNLDNPALTTCHNFDTNLTWSLIINVYDSWSWVLTWSWDIQALRRENKIWFDSSFNLREEIGDNLLFSFFSQSGSYNWEVIVEYNNWNNSEIVQTFIIQSQWYEWYVIGVNPLPTKTIDTSQCKLDVDNDDDVEFLNWEFFIWFYNCFVYSIDTINSGFESVFKLTNTVKNIWNTNEEKSLFNFLFWIKSANASDFTNAFNERDETTLFYKIPHFIIWWFYTFLIITWLWFLISLKNK